jgi:hypothetical protein
MDFNIPLGWIFAPLNFKPKYRPFLISSATFGRSALK